MRNLHLCISVRGNLRKPDSLLAKEWKHALQRDDGSYLKTGREIREFFLDHLSQGHEVIPFGEPCEGFDYKKGCPGHEIPDEDEKAEAQKNEL